MQDTLISGFIRSVHAYGNQIAITAPSGTYTYTELYRRASAIAASLSGFKKANSGLVPILVERDLSAFVGILGILLSGNGYVPISSSFPPSRIATIISDIGGATLLTDSASLPLALEATSSCDSVLRILMLDAVNLASSTDSPDVDIVLPLEAPDNWVPLDVSPEALAYVFYTSGSTGTPKGVKITHSNIVRYINYMSERYELSCSDRILQITDLTFDLSVFEQFMAWQAGCCLCVPSYKDKLGAAKFIRDTKITTSLLTPSMALLMRKLRQLQPGAFPDLRVSLFCGEALHCEVAEAWAEAAPASIVENIYGPTELVVSCMIHRWDSVYSKKMSINNVVPIGQPHEDIDALIVDEAGNILPAGELGELLISGPQTEALGYWRNEEKTREVLVEIPGYNFLCYRTGDLAIQDPQDGLFNWVGRVDQQIKYVGHRIERGDIEAAIRRCFDCQQAVIVPWPIVNGQIMGLVAFVEADNDIANDRFVATLLKEIPDYMVPKKVIILDRFPINTSGKVDRPKLKSQLVQAQ